MGRCALCKHPDRASTEEKIISKELSMTVAARLINSNKATVSRHMSHCVPKAIAEAAKPEPAEVSGLNVANQLVELNATTRKILTDALTDGDTRTALKAIERAEKQLEFQAKLLGLFKERVEITNEVSQWNIIITFVRAVEETPELNVHPELKEALSRTLMVLAGAGVEAEARGATL
jgi:regulator of RNase E activity RraB